MEGRSCSAIALSVFFCINEIKESCQDLGTASSTTSIKSKSTTSSKSTTTTSRKMNFFGRNEESPEGCPFGGGGLVGLGKTSLNLEDTMVPTVELYMTLTSNVYIFIHK